MNFRLERLTEHHPVAASSSGQRAESAAIDDYLRTRALAEQTEGWSRVTVAVDPDATSDKDRIVGYFSVSPCSMRLDPGVIRALALGQACPLVGGYLLGRMGVAAKWQGQGLGELLVERAFATARVSQVRTGGVFLAVDARSEALVAWYLAQPFGWTRLSAEKRRLVARL